MITLCSHEAEVVAAAIHGRLDAPLMRHLESCESCRAAVAMISLFRPDEPGSHDTTADALMRDIIWAQALYVVRQRRKRMQKLGPAVGMTFGILAGCLTGVVAMPSDSAISLSQFTSLLAPALPALGPLALILCAVLFVVFANSLTGPVSGHR